ncbi:MAG TPA: hypothetical protein PLE22_00125 [Acidovorax sp.]|jgi:hypothetical protein|nr:hypothetical protein [Acidovorax sp.]
MTTFIILLSVIAIVHFVYESIIAPSLRMHLRNKLFELRDEVRAVRVEGVDPDDEKAYWYTHDGINNLLDRLSWMTLHARVTATMAYAQDADLQKLVEERKAMLDQCKNRRIHKIFDKTSLVVEEAFVVNMGAWAIYVVPIGVFFSSLGQLKKLVSNLILTPERKREEMLPRPVLAG